MWGPGPVCLVELADGFGISSCSMKMDNQEYTLERIEFIDFFDEVIELFITVRIYIAVPENATMIIPCPELASVTLMQLGIYAISPKEWHLPLLSQ